MSSFVSLIIGQRPDPHMDALESELRALGSRVVQFKSHQLDHVDDYMTYRCDGNGMRMMLRTSQGTIDGSDINAVFWRVKAPLFGLPFKHENRLDHDFRFKEWDKAVGGLSMGLSHATWINPYEAHWLAGNKVRQLQMASHLGIAIPRTVISNVASEIRPLFDQGAVIYKTLSNPFHSADRIIFTTRISREEFEDRADTIAMAPCLFQQYVPKAFELRVTVIGNSIMALRIDSQSNPVTEVDWRLAQGDRSLYSPFDLPADVSRKILELMAEMNLSYGALDFVVTPDGEYVFLEINPGGQWLWLERLTGLPITKEIATAIVCPQNRSFAFAA